MKLKHILLLGYVLIGLGYAIYAANWGEEAFRGFAFNLGKGTVWPLVIFPGLGKIVGAFILLIVIGAVVAS